MQGKVLPGSKAAQVCESVIDPQALSQRPASQAQSDAVVASQLACVVSALQVLSTAANLYWQAAACWQPGTAAQSVG